MQHERRGERLNRAAETLWRDVRLGVRTIGRTPGVSALVAITLALAIGANTAIFSLFYGILLRPFPYVDPDRLVRVQSHYRTNDNVRENSLADFDDLREQNRTFVDLGLYIPFNTDLLGNGPAKPIRMSWVTPATFSVLGVSPMLGRAFSPTRIDPVVMRTRRS
jgi:putative ABC transport system permease protein